MEADEGGSSQATVTNGNSTARTTGTTKEPDVSRLAIDIEFENAWETTSDWNEDDIDAVMEEYTLCFPGDAPKKPTI
jgi:CTD kinase subunit gamma